VKRKDVGKSWITWGVSEVEAVKHKCLLKGKRGRDFCPRAFRRTAKAGEKWGSRLFIKRCRGVSAEDKPGQRRGGPQENLH